VQLVTDNAINGNHILGKELFYSVKLQVDSCFSGGRKGRDVMDWRISCQAQYGHELR